MSNLSDQAALEFSKRSAASQFGQLCTRDGWQECRRITLEVLDSYIDHIASPNECDLLREIRRVLLTSK